MASPPDFASGRPANADARYFALLYSPPSQRRVLEALLGIEREVLASLQPGLDHHVAHSRLTWWGDECERAAGGKAAHPLTQELVRTVALPMLANLKGLVDAAVWDLARATFETRREVGAYCSRWAAAMSIATTGLAMEDTERFVRAATAVRELELLAGFAAEARHGRLRLPLDELEAAGADPADAASPPWPPAMADVLRARYGSLRAELALSLSDLPSQAQPDARGLLVWATLAARQSVRAAAALPQPAHTRRLDALLDGWTAWRTATKATRGRFLLE